MHSSYKSYKIYKNDSINAGFVKNVQMLAQPGSALFRYVAKMAAVKYEECASIDTLQFDRTPSGSFQYTYFRPNLNWNTLRTQTKYSEYG